MDQRNQTANVSACNWACGSASECHLSLGQLNFCVREFRFGDKSTNKKNCVLVLATIFLFLSLVFVSGRRAFCFGVGKRVLGKRAAGKRPGNGERSRRWLAPLAPLRMYPGYLPPIVKPPITVLFIRLSLGGFHYEKVCQNNDLSQKPPSIMCKCY